MHCPRCGRETTPGKLDVVGTTLECQLCLGCNHLYLPWGLAEHKQANLPALPAPPRAQDIPAVERCPLTEEQEAGARRLLGS